MECSDNDSFFIAYCRSCRVWITCTLNARSSTQTSSQKTFCWEWTRLTFRNWRPTPSCGSYQYPLLLPAPQVSDTALAMKCIFRCNYKGICMYQASWLKFKKIVCYFFIIYFFPTSLPCWCFYFLPVNRSSRDKQVCNLTFILLFIIIVFILVRHLYFWIIASWPVHFCYDFLLRVCPACWGSWLGFSTLLESG